MSKFLILVDSSSDISALPTGWIKPSSVTRKIINGPTIQSNVSCTGYVNLTLDFGFEKSFPWKFAVCNFLRKPILSADILSNYSLLVDTANQRLLQRENFCQNSSNVSTFSSNKFTMGNMIDEVLDGDVCTFAVPASIPQSL